MTVISAQYASPDNSSILVFTAEAGCVLVPVNGEDPTDGVRDDLYKWTYKSDANQIQPYTEPEQP